MCIKRSTALLLMGLAFTCLSTPLLADDGHDGARYSWVIFQYANLTSTSFTIAPGGLGVSQATFYPAQGAGDNSTITVTGSGTFRVNDGEDVSGGGTWATAAADGTATGSGTYRVTRLIFFELGAGTLAGAPGITDDTGNLADTVAGLAVFKVRYSDGTDGMLVVSCNIGGPQAVIEGITATKGVVDYSNPLIPDITTGNTLFHRIH